jgi:ElaB/YqjD/DUF883 family membrane-anchored ribosome-binding protein
MIIPNHSSRHETASLVEGVSALMAATSDIAGGKVSEARERLAVALEGTRKMASNIRNRAIAGAKATDKIVKHHPYKSIALVLGIGALLGIILARRHARKEA